MASATASGSASGPLRARVRMSAPARPARRASSDRDSPPVCPATATAAARTRASSSVSHTRSWVPRGNGSEAAPEIAERVL